MKTLTRRLLLPLVLLGLAAAPAPVAVSSAPGPGVTGADLPQVTRVARIYGDLRGGSRELNRSTTLEIPGRSCVTYGRGVPTSSVRFASYLEADGQAPFFSGHEDPTFVVYEFAGPVRARAALLELVDYVDRCAGRRHYRGTTRTVHRVRVPDLGAREIAYRTTVTDGGSVHHDLEIYVRHGRRLERSWVQVDGRPADLGRAVRMARLLAEVARR